MRRRFGLADRVAGLLDLSLDFRGMGVIPGFYDQPQVGRFRAGTGHQTVVRNFQDVSAGVANQRCDARKDARPIAMVSASTA